VTSACVRRRVVSVVDDFSERLIQRNHENVGEVGYHAWAALSPKEGNKALLPNFHVALPTLSYTLARRNLPVSALVVAALIAYAELIRSTGDEDFNRLPPLLTLPFSFFVDWDRGRSARHELVDAYLYSSWPPADLLLASIHSVIQQNTLKRLSRTYRGSDDIAAIDRDSHRPHRGSALKYRPACLDGRDIDFDNYSRHGASL
jgi:hypothetical protein